MPANLVTRIWEWHRRGELTDARIEEIRTGSPLGRLLAAGLINRNHSREIMKEAIEDTGRQVVAELERFLNSLGTIASVAPLLGLLGTVLGMIDVFGVIMNAGVGNAAMLAGGISKALITTAAGLSVAIPAPDVSSLLRQQGRAARTRHGGAVAASGGGHEGRARGRRGLRVNLRPHRREPADINITPLIDVVFLLLIFFMVSTTFKDEARLRVQLPEAQGEEIPAEEPEMIRLVIDRTGSFNVDDRAVLDRKTETLVQVLKDRLGGGQAAARADPGRCTDAASGGDDGARCGQSGRTGADRLRGDPCHAGRCRVGPAVAGSSAPPFDPPAQSTAGEVAE